MILSDETIIERLGLPAGDPLRLVIEPFALTTRETGRLSHGLSSYGYDVRLGSNFRLFDPLAQAAVIDPLRFDPMLLRTFRGERCVIPPHSYVLAETFERVEMPRDTLGLLIGKSTYARCGLILNCTPIEPGWRGYITLEIANTTPLPAVVYAEQGIGQLVFLGGDRPPAADYGQKPGARYQDQLGVTAARP